MAVGIVLLSVATLLLFLVALRHTDNIKMLSAVVDAGWFGVLLTAVGLLVTIYSGFLIAAAPGIPCGACIAACNAANYHSTDKTNKT
jgi:formate-dependent nitrite reductase membrane component NrfD